PDRVGAQLPRIAVVRKQRLDDATDPRTRLRVVDRDDGFHAPIEVAFHEVRRADVPLLRTAVGKPEDARVLEELAHDGPNADPLGSIGQARPERADAADDEIHVDTGAAGPVERLDAGRIDDRV